MAARERERVDPDPLLIAEAVAEQERLARRVVREDRFSTLANVCGVDVHYPGEGRVAYAAAVVLAYPTLEPLDRASVRRPISFPYVPGLLSFREAPAALDALAALRVRPDLVFCDGQGIAHPRRCGLASQVGVLAGVPTIGVAKTRLIGEAREPGARRGAWTSLRDRGEEIGAVVRTRSGVKPVYVSIGHRLSLATAIEIALACAPRFRVPEPIRAADRLARSTGRS